MKIIQAAVLLLVGALGAMLYLKVTGSSEPQTAVVQPEPQPVSSVAPVTAPVPEPAPVKPDRVIPEKRRSPEPVRRRSSEPPSTVASIQPVQQFPPSQPQAPVSAPAPIIEPAPKPVEAPPPPPPPPPARKVTLAAGTLLPVRLVETVSSDRNHPGDTFNASLDEPLVVDGFVIAERGARLEGRILDTTQAGRVKGLSSIGLQLTSLTTSDGQTIEILTDSFTKAGPESKGEDAAKIGGAAAIGAVIGAIAGGGKGAAIGAGAGGAAGTGGVIATRGKPAVLASETKLSFRLNTPVTITEQRRRR
jgi:hypothetical protein